MAIPSAQDQAPASPQAQAPGALDADTVAGGAALPRRGLRRSSATTDLALISTFAALIVVCALAPRIAVGGLPVPITLQTLGVMIAGAVLGWRRGLLAVLLYLLVGFAGVPVFADGASGLGVLTRASAGYLIAFPLAAALVGLLVERIPRGLGATARTGLVFVSALVASVATIHPLGVLGLMVRAGYSLSEAVAIDLTFIPGDLIKNAVTAVVATAVFRAFPALTSRR